MRIRTLFFRLVLAVILIPVIWLCLIMFEPEVILFQAMRIASDRPYCIVVADHDHNLAEYKVAVRRGDLTFSALTTHLDWGGSGGPFADTYYSLLILENPHEVRNWSKFYLNFESDVEPMQSSLVHTDIGKLCTPVVNFAKSIRYW
jgi:hypothetical protein